MNKREKSRPTRPERHTEDTGIVVDDFSEEFIKNSGSISNHQATEKDIGLEGFMSIDAHVEEFPNEEMEQD